MNNLKHTKLISSFIKDAEDVINLPGALDKRKLGLTEIQRKTMAQVILTDLRESGYGLKKIKLG